MGMLNKITPEESNTRNHWSILDDKYIPLVVDRVGLRLFISCVSIPPVPPHVSLHHVTQLEKHIQQLKQ
jgi:hypothetical protein